MKHCPNPLCPHRVRTGGAARYAPDRDRCEDCHGPLSVGEVPAARVRAVPPQLSAPTGLFHRAAITLACLSAFVLANHGRVPGMTRVQEGPRTFWPALAGEDIFLRHGLGRLCVGFLLA